MAPAGASESIPKDLDPGIWKMKLDYNAATGDFRIHWRAHKWPIHSCRLGGGHSLSEESAKVLTGNGP
jgi:hypothetical protein